MIIEAFPYALREVSFAACPDYCLSCLVNIYKCDTEKCARGFGVSTVTGNCIREYNHLQPSSLASQYRSRRTSFVYVTCIWLCCESVNIHARSSTIHGHVLVTTCDLLSQQYKLCSRLADVSSIGWVAATDLYSCTGSRLRYA